MTAVSTLQHTPEGRPTEGWQALSWGAGEGLFTSTWEVSLAGCLGKLLYPLSGSLSAQELITGLKPSPRTGCLED